MILSSREYETIVCIGIDGKAEGHTINRACLAINKEGILAFSTTLSFLSSSSLKQKESNIFALDEKRIYMCCDYDINEITEIRTPTPSVDAVLDSGGAYGNVGGPIHSGDARFVRFGLAGASRAWKCPVFASIIYINRRIAPRWPSGVMWDQGTMELNKWSCSTQPNGPPGSNRI